MYYVYILKSEKDNGLYTGSTENLKERITAHNSGKVTATKHGGPWKLLYYEAFTSKTNARREELFLKSGKGRERIKWLFNNQKQ